MDKLLLHACCGPCSTSCVERLRALDIEPVLYFANDNLASREEYDRRLDALQTFAKAAGVEVRAKPYDHDAWRAAVRGLEGEPEGGRRCDACFRHNLAAAAETAAHDGFEGFSSTLSVSPHKSSPRLFAAGHAVERPGCPFVEHDFKKRAGFLRSVQLAAEYGLYRQTFCGCEFSRHGENPKPLSPKPATDNQTLDFGLQTSDSRAAAPAGRTGQAIVELVIALFAILVIVGGLLQLVILAHADTETMAEATATASDAASTEGSFSDTFSAVRDWEPGTDGMVLTRDDRKVGGSLSRPRHDIAARTAPGGDWSALDDSTRTDIRSFAERDSSAAFGFVHARSERDVDVLPLAGPLFGIRNASTGNDVWMVKVNDLY